MSSNLDAVRAAVIQGKALALEFMTATASFYEDGDTTPVFVSPCRVKKAKPSAFKAGNETEWSTARHLMISIPISATSGLVKKGLIVQVDGVDGDPTLNHVNFIVQSAIDSGFAATRNVVVKTEVVETPRVV